MIHAQFFFQKLFPPMFSITFIHRFSGSRFQTCPSLGSWVQFVRSSQTRPLQGSPLRWLLHTWGIQDHQGETSRPVDGSKKIPGFTPFEVGRISYQYDFYRDFFQGFNNYIQTVVGFGISEPSTVSSVTVSRYDSVFRMQIWMLIKKMLPEFHSVPHTNMLLTTACKAVKEVNLYVEKQLKEWLSRFRVRKCQTPITMDSLNRSNPGLCIEQIL